MYENVAVEAGLPALCLSFFEPARETQGTVRNGSKLSSAYAAHPARAFQLAITTGAKGWERGVDEGSGKLSGHSPCESGERQVLRPDGGVE
jgi:hypothetical protein